MKNFKSYLAESEKDEYEDFFPHSEEQSPADGHRKRFIFHLVRSRIHRENAKVIPDVEAARLEHLKSLHHHDLAKHYRNEYRKITQKTLPLPEKKEE